MCRSSSRISFGISISSSSIFIGTRLTPPRSTFASFQRYITHFCIYFSNYLQSSETGKFLNVCWKFIILEIFLHGQSGQNRGPISKCTQCWYVTTSKTPQTYRAIRATTIIYLSFSVKKYACVNLDNDLVYLTIIRALEMTWREVIPRVWPRIDDSRSGSGWSRTALFALPFILSFHKNGNSSLSTGMHIFGGFGSM